MSYPFNGDLIKRVLNDQSFQQNGFYVGKVAPFHYVVLDPRRRNVNVWTKRGAGTFDIAKRELYRKAGAANGTIFATNGPPMEPPPFTGSAHLPAPAKIVAGFAYSSKTGIPWLPYDAARSGGKELDPGAANTKWVFERTGQGSYAAYSIFQGKPKGVEAFGGCYGIVSGGTVVVSADHDGLKASSGGAAWCKCPINPAMDTVLWETATPWFSQALNEVDQPNPLDGVIIGVAMGVSPKILATKVIEVGCTDAVAMDGSDSVLCAYNGALRIKCDWKKDVVQRWGFCVS